MYRLLCALAATLLLAAPCLLGQSLPDPDPFFHGTLQEALDKSVQSHRALLVYLRPAWAKRGDAHDLMERTTWKNQTLASWIQWHGVAYQLNQSDDAGTYSAVRDAVNKALEEAARKTAARGLSMLTNRPAGIGTMPIVAVFVDGRLDRTIPDTRFQGYLFESVPFGNGEPPDATVFYPKAVQLLFSLDFMMECLAATDPIWSEQHRQKNPQPAPPPPVYFHDVGDATAAPIPDPDPAAPGAVLDRLDEARRAIEEGGILTATGLYTWLIERGDAYDPAFRAARRTFLAAELCDLRRFDGLAERITLIRDTASTRTIWFEYGDLLDWVCLNNALADPQLTLLYLVRETVDEQEATMLTPFDRSAYKLLEHTEDWSEPARNSPEAIQWARAQALRLQGPKVSRDITDDEWLRVQRLRAMLVHDELCRAYAAALIHSDPAAANLASSTLLHTFDDADARLSLVVTALVAGQPRAEQRAWLQQAADLGTPRPDLAARLDSAIGPDSTR